MQTAPPPDLDPAELDRLRRRIVWTLFATSALGSTGYIAAVTVGTLAAADLWGDAAFGGMPTAAATIGTAAGATLLSAFMLRAGRRRGLIVGLSIGAVGAAIAFGAVVAGSIVVLLLASGLTGAANASGNLGRFVAGDLVPPERRGSTIGIVVWGATIGAVAGPNLVAPAGAAAAAVGLPELAGPYALTVGFIGLAVALAAFRLRPEPYTISDASARHSGDGAPTVTPLGDVLRRPPVAVGLVALVTGQVVMLLLMTMTPIHLTEHGHGLETVGFVLSAHIFGMFALSPVSGRLSDRLGAPTVIGLGLGTLAVSGVLAALAPPDGGVLLTVALFLLGYGWNLGFVAGSSLLTGGLALGDRTRVQGLADGLTWSSAAVASLSSGIILAATSFALLGLIAVALLVPAATLLVTRRSQLNVQAAPGPG